MMSSTIPKMYLRDIQQLQRNFIWSDEIGRRKYHAIDWQTVTLTKRLGGPGIRDLVTMNNACLMKLSWSLREDNNKLWCQVLKGKYRREATKESSLVVKSADSNLWKHVAKNWSKSK